MSYIHLVSYIEQHEALLLSLGAISLLMFIGTLIAVPWLVLRIPEDYFSERERGPAPWKWRHPVLRALLLVGKNLAGGLFIVLGVAMLILPGQGLLTILIGIILLDFPGKFRFERWLVRRRPILLSVNWLRRRRGRPPLVFE